MRAFAAALPALTRATRATCAPSVAAPRVFAHSARRDGAHVLSPVAASAALGQRIARVSVAQTHAELEGTDKSGRHSCLTRVSLDYSDGAAGSAANDILAFFDVLSERSADHDHYARPGSLIVKRVVCAELPDRGELPSSFSRAPPFATRRRRRAGLLAVRVAPFNGPRHPSGASPSFYSGASASQRCSTPLPAACSAAVADQVGHT